MSPSIVALGDVVTFKGGGTPDRANTDYWGGQIPWTTVKDLNHGFSLRQTQEFITEKGLQNSASNLVPAGTVIIPTRMALGKAVIAETNVAINQDLKAVFPVAGLNPRYLLWYFATNASKIAAMGKGATVKGVTLDQLRKLQVPLPSLAEQQRIAAILDKADALRAKRREAIAKLDQLLQSVFLDMFGDPVINPRSWPKATVGALASFITSGSRGWAKYYAESGAKFIRIQNLVGGELDLSDCAFVNPPETAEARRTQVQPNDVLVSITADLGRTAVVPSGLGRSHINQHIALLRLEGVNAAYASHFLAGPGGQLQFGKLNRSAVKAGLNFNDLRSLEILLPPEALQQKYLRVIATVREAQTKMSEALKGADRLFGEIQHQLFAGML